MAAIGLHGVEKTYPGGVRAVRALDLEIGDGELVVLVGPSGCGKSTLLRLVAGLETPTAGTISIGGRDVAGVAPRDRDVAMVFQSYALYPHMTVRGNLSFGLKMRRTPKAEITRRVDAVAALLDIGALLDRRPDALSGGQQQRVALGRAIVREPRCFLLDEPLSNLDARLRTSMRAELKALHARLGITTIHVTHDQEEAMTLGDRVVVLREGVLQQVGPPLEVYRRPANRFVAGFVGSPPMNQVTGTVGNGAFDDGRGVRLALDGAAPPGGAVVLGVRPEALRPANDGIETVVRLCEPVGDRMDLHVETAGGTGLVARIPVDDAIAVGQTIRFDVPDDARHWFTADDLGQRL